MKLKLTQESRDYETEEGRPVSLRIIQPSPPCGGWPGNDKTIRVWEHVPEGATYRRCTDEQVNEFEAALGEVKCVAFLIHPTLGRVAYEVTADDDKTQGASDNRQSGAADAAAAQ